MVRVKGTFRARRPLSHNPPTNRQISLDSPEMACTFGNRRIDVLLKETDANMEDVGMASEFEDSGIPDAQHYYKSAAKEENVFENRLDFIPRSRRITVSPNRNALQKFGYRSVEFLAISPKKSPQEKEDFKREFLPKTSTNRKTRKSAI